MPTCKESNICPGIKLFISVSFSIFYSIMFFVCKMRLLSFFFLLLWIILNDFTIGVACYLGFIHFTFFVCFRLLELMLPHRICLFYYRFIGSSVRLKFGKFFTTC